MSLIPAYMFVPRSICQQASSSFIFFLAGVCRQHHAAMINSDVVLPLYIHVRAVICKVFSR